jgi:N-hydroxyarylamine O-acetyltransferase
MGAYTPRWRDAEDPVHRSQVDAYLSRIGVTRPARADADSLRGLQLRHLLTVPFENLSIHLDEGITLDADALVEKVTQRRRGGFCYELNGAFSALLSALGFHVTLLAARVVGDDDDLGPPFDHLTLRVDTPAAPDARGPWLADVGFGGFTHHPLRLDVRTDQPDPAGTFRITEHEHGDLEISQDGRPQYRIEPRPRRLRDFDATCWWHQTAPKSHFTQSVVCSMLTETGRVTLSDRKLIRTIGSERHEQVLDSDTDVLAAYRTHFGIVLDRVPSHPRPFDHEIGQPNRA